MQELQFKSTIAASRDAVWHALWDDTSYRDWSSVFAPGSRAETDWKKGSKVLFVDGQGSGMVSVIADLKKDEFMSFKHLGTVKDGVEQIDTPESKDWEGTENYTLQDVNGKTELTVDLQFGKMAKDFVDYFKDTFPKALERIKALAENMNITA